MLFSVQSMARRKYVWEDVGEIERPLLGYCNGDYKEIRLNHHLYTFYIQSLPCRRCLIFTRRGGDWEKTTANAKDDCCVQFNRLGNKICILLDISIPVVIQLHTRHSPNGQYSSEREPILIRIKQSVVGDSIILRSHKIKQSIVSGEVSEL